MIDLGVIWSVAHCEARLLWRSWAFRLSALVGLVLLFFFNLILIAPFSNAPHHFRALSSGLPLTSIRLLSLYLGFVAAFLATEFVKRDRQQDTAQTTFVHSFTNADYLMGKMLGVGAVFGALHLIVLLPVAVTHRFFASDTIFAWEPYLLLTLFSSLPTLIFTIGLSCLLVTLLRSQALAFAVMAALSMLFLIVLGPRYFYYFDTFGFSLPLFYSDFIGLGNLDQLLLVRGTHALFGVSCIGLTGLLSSRLRQSLSANLATALVVAACLAGATWTSLTYLQGKWADRAFREQLAVSSRMASAEPAPSVVDYDLAVEHNGHQLAIVARLSVTNQNDVPLDSLLFTLNPGLLVGEVTADDLPVPFTQELHLLRIAPAVALAHGDTCNLRISYSGTVDERFCYLDIETERYEGQYRMWLFSMPKAYAFVTPRFLHLTAESAWYPLGGLPPGTAFPESGRRDYARYRLSIAVPRDWTAISQGAVEIDTSGAKSLYRFRTETALPQTSLTAGRYELRQITVDDVSYSLAVLPGHTYFDAYFDSVGAALPGLIREIKNDYEAALGLEYPHPRLSLVEVPIQFFAYRRLWTVAQESVQPELVFLPEMGALCEGCDFRRQKRRSTRSQERANMAENAVEIQSKYLRTFAMVDLLGMRDPGGGDLSRNSSLETRWYLLPNYLSYATHLFSARWPVLNFAFESYFRERISAPKNTWSRQWSGMTETERANLALKQHGLADLLGDVEGVGKSIREIALRAKGRHLLMLFAAASGPKAFGEKLTAFVHENRYRNLSDTELIAFLAGLDQGGISHSGRDRRDPAALIDSWFRDTELPGYQVERTESYLVRDGERTRTQVELDISNPTDVDGLVEVNIRYRQSQTLSWWERRAEGSDYARTLYLPARTRKSVGFLLDQPVAEMILDTYVSQNIPSLIQVPFHEQKLRRHAEPLSGERSEPLPSDADETDEYVVDNEDEGFTVLDAERTSWLRRLIVDLFDLEESEVHYTGLHAWNPPNSWSATSDGKFYGRFILSGYYKKAGDGRSKVAWRTQIDREGDFDLYYYCGHPDELRWARRNHRGTTSLSFMVYHEDGVENVSLDLQDAEEGWNLLGSYRLAAGPAHVELSDRGSGRTVIADAVKWVRRM